MPQTETIVTAPEPAGVVSAALRAKSQARKKAFASSVTNAAREEAAKRGLGPRITDWFVRGAYAAAIDASDGPKRSPTRAWWHDGVRWFRSREQDPLSTTATIEEAAS